MRTLVFISFLLALQFGCGSQLETMQPNQLKAPSINSLKMPPQEASAMVDCGPEGSDPLVQRLSRSNSNFAFSLYGALKDNPGNLFLSPYSISAALAMTHAGARGTTKADMASTLQLGLNDAEINPTFRVLNANIMCASSPMYELTIANALWGQKNYRFDPSYLQQAVTNYNSHVATVDFATSPDSARQTINDWFSNQTKARIQDIVPAGSLTDQTKLVLTNAIHYQGSWLYEFSKDQTKVEPFWTIEDSATDVAMMHNTRSYLYDETSEAQVLELPLLAEKGSANFKQALVIMLPKTGHTVNRLAESLNADKFNQIRHNLDWQYVRFAMPKFSFATELGLKETLAGLGMASAFTPGQADFSGMFERGQEPLYLDNVNHKAFIDVNEEGIEAKATTAAVIASYSVTPEPIDMIANKPFLFFIMDNDTNSILFMGRISDPKSTR